MTLTPTVTQQCVSVMIEDDSVLEETESLTVSLSLTGAPDGAQLSQQIATVIVTDEDGNEIDNHATCICTLILFHNHY